MKKFLKYFLFSFVCCLGLCVFSFNPHINSFLCSAENVSNTCVVNFYSADGETLLFSREVEKGTTLNDIKSNNIIPMWTDQVINSRGLTFSYDHVTQIYSVTGTCNGTSEGRVFTFDSPLDYFVGETNWCSVLYSVNSRGNTPSICLASPGSLYSDNIAFNYDYGLNYTFNHDVTWNNLRFYTINGNSYDYSFRLFLRKGPYFTSHRIPYEYTFNDFNKFINEQYLYSAGVSDYETNVSWSISPNSDSKFNFDSPINKDYNFYGFIDDGEIYDFEGVLDSRLSEIGNYAIKDIVSFNIDGFYLYKYSISLKTLPFLVISCSDVSSANYTANSIILNSDSRYCDFNMAVVSSSNLTILRSEYSSPMSMTSIPAYFVSASDRDAVLTFYFSNYAIDFHETYNVFTFDNGEYSTSANYLFDENLNQLVDMNSNTNFTYSLLSDYAIWKTHNTFDYLSYFLNFNLLNNDSEDLDVYYLPNSDVGSNYQFGFFKVGTGVTDLSDKVNNLIYIQFYDLLTQGSFNYYDLICDYVIQDYYFVIDKPAYRVNNSLCIYNFDYYNTLNNVTSLTYELAKNGNYYDITYTGSITNSKYLYFDCAEIDNTIFDRYVFLFFDFSNTHLNLLENKNYVYYSVGFDFNFVYYSQPLTTSNGIYPYSYNEPDYVDMTPTLSLVPPSLYIPWNNVFHNIIVFACFKFPLVSDIFRAVGLTTFIGALLNVFDFIFSYSLGQFLTGLFAFLILFALIKTLFPFAYSVGKSIYDNSQFAFNRKVSRERKYAKNYNKKYLKQNKKYNINVIRIKNKKSSNRKKK